MGASVSTNVINMISKVVANATTTIAQKTMLSEDSTQMIWVDHIDGDVTIKGNVFYQRAHVNMNLLMRALTTQEAQQRMAVELSQQAKSLVSGLNIGQFSKASNTVDLLIEASMNLMSTITQTCAARVGESQSLIIKRVRGNVLIQNNVYDQMSDLVISCVQDAVSSSSEIQDLKVKLDQTAEAKSEGLSGWIIVALVAVVLIVPVGGAAVLGSKALRYMFPIVAVAGLIMLAVYFLYTTDTVTMYGFTLIGEKDACLPIVLDKTTALTTVAQGHEQCLKNKDCKAFQYKAMTIHPDGTYNPVAPPETTFFSDVGKYCEDSLTKDISRTLRLPQFFSGSDDPSSVFPPSQATLEGDAYLNTTTMTWFQFYGKSGGWTLQEVLIKNEPMSRMVLGREPPSKPAATDGLYYLYFDSNSPMYMTVYKYSNASASWSTIAKYKGPGLVPDVPDHINGSGLRAVIRKQNLLYVAIGALALGVVGTILTMTLGIGSDSSASVKTR